MALAARGFTCWKGKLEFTIENFGKTLGDLRHLFGFMPYSDHYDDPILKHFDEKTLGEFAALINRATAEWLNVLSKAKFPIGGQNYTMSEFILEMLTQNWMETHPSDNKEHAKIHIKSLCEEWFTSLKEFLPYT